jgi:hypothetical protein
MTPRYGDVTRGACRLFRAAQRLCSYLSFPRQLRGCELRGIRRLVSREHDIVQRTAIAPVLSEYRCYC